jgi:molecular chaperone DnaJ
VRSGKKGDQHVVIQITTPKNISNQEKKLYEDLAKLESKSKDQCVG